MDGDDARIAALRPVRITMHSTLNLKYGNAQQVGGGNAHELPSHPSAAPPKARATP